MDANTPATQSSSSSSPDEDRPMHDSPISPISPIKDTVSAPEPSPSAPAPPPMPAPATASLPATTPTASLPGTTPTAPLPATAAAPARPKGPNSGAVVLGLVALVLAAGIIATETMSVRVDWVALGPGAIVGVGVLLVVLGAVGLARRRGES